MSYIATPELRSERAKAVYASRAVERILERSNAAVTLRLSKGQIALIDLEDEEKVCAIKWHAATNKSGITYAKSHPPGSGRANTKKLYLHRFILDAKPGEIVDHINSDGLDNRKANLRIVTARQNVMNSKPKGGRQLKGVKVDPVRNAFAARIAINGRDKYLGLYATATEAARAYDEAARVHFGEFAKLNFPTERITPERLNRIPLARSGYHGVHPRGRKFYAVIGKTYLGMFPDAVSAAEAYDTAARKLFGEFARPNFPTASAGTKGAA